MSNIFISYRRKDSAGTTERLREYLEKALEEKHNIFLDTKAIAAGDSFEDRIVRGCLKSWGGSKKALSV
jgi:hypothetical protein